MTQVLSCNDVSSNNLPVEELKTKLKGSTVLTPESEGYLSSLRRWSTTAEKRAAIVVCATSAEDISAAILFARAHSLELVVCGGGHSSRSSILDGMVIDLGPMRHVHVDARAQTVTAQGGCLVEDLDAALQEHNLMFAGGAVSHVGIGGLTLGGGYGALTGQHGLTLDNLLTATMVLADGSIQTASASENPALFWAIRGAGPCFGVVVSFTFRVHRQPPAGVWAGSMYFPAGEKLGGVVEFANRFVAATDGKSALTLVLHRPPHAAEMAVGALVFHDGPEAQARQIFGPLFALEPSVCDVKLRPYEEVTRLQNAGTRPGMRRETKGACFVTPVAVAFVAGLVDELARFYAAVPEAQATVLVLEFYATAKVASVPDSATAFANRGHHQNFHAAAGWLHEKNDRVCARFVERVARLCRTELEGGSGEGARSNGSKYVTEYGNYDGLGTADAKRIFGVNYRRLNHLKGLYDPDNVFKGGYPDLRKDLYLPWDPEED